MRITSEERLNIIEKRILREVKAYVEKFGKGMQMKILSVKYGRALQELGGFPEFITALQSKGILRVELEENGARFVYLGNGPILSKAADFF